MPRPVDLYRSVDRTARQGGRPWVLANMVAGLDGSAAVGGRVGALSSPVDQQLFRELRSVADVVLVGAETVRREGYGPVRLPEDLQERRRQEGRERLPRLAIVSGSLRLPWGSPLFSGAERPYVVTSEMGAPEGLREAADAAELVLAGRRRVDVVTALSELSARGAQVVLCEGGPSLLGELVAADALDELCLTIAPVLGGDPLPVAVTPDGGAALLRLELASALVDDATLFLRYERTGAR